MIHDRLDNAGAYAGLGPRFAQAFSWLAATDLTALPEGRVDLAGPGGDDLHALVQLYTTEPREGRSLETHVRYADIQVLVEGEETIAYRQASGLAQVAAHDEGRDFGLCSMEGAMDLRLRAGEFAVFLPQDGHAPKIAAGRPAAVRKIVVKVRL